MAGLLKDACMRRELKRATRTVIRPETSETIDIENIGNTGDSERGYELIAQVIGRDAPPNAFAGWIVIQDHLSAMKHALSEHKRDCMRRKEPGRHSFHVDAAISQRNGRAGLGVVHKAHRQDWASPWIAKGFRIHGTLDQEEAELWAIWQALQLTIEQAHSDRTQMRPRDPCSLVVIYSDAMSGLCAIRNYSGGAVVKEIIAQSMELERLSIKVQFHWTPGHRNIPGNELADLVSKRARQVIN